MGMIGNLLWFIFVGFWQGLSWFFIGCLWSISIIGIPVGKQCFKLAKLTFFPFGKEIIYCGGGVSLVLNIFWLLFGGIPLAVAAIGNGVVLCLTILGIPFGLQCFKFAQLAFMPFGAKVIKN